MLQNAEHKDTLTFPLSTAVKRNESQYQPDKSCSDAGRASGKNIRFVIPVANLH